MDFWKRNRELLMGREEAGDQLPPIPWTSPALRRAKLLAGPPPSLAVPGPHGRPITLHSRRHPWEEGEQLVQGVKAAKEEPLIVLGLGLGYHLLALLPRLPPEQPLLVVEPEPEVFYAAMASMDLKPLLGRRATLLIVEPDPRRASRELRRRLGKGRGRPPRFWGHPASVRVRPDYYEQVIQAFSSPARPLARQPSLHRERLRVLVVNPDYFLIPEVLRALARLGHEAELFSFDKRREPGEEVVRRLLLRLATDPPDLVFTVNHLGLDREGVLLESLHRLRLPLVSWYVDSPALILNLYEGRKSEFAYIFSWDPTYIPRIKALGFQHVYPLPLATDPDIFAPRPARELRAWRSQVSFVGNSLTWALREKLARLPQHPEFHQLFSRLAAAYRQRPHRSLKEVLDSAHLGDDPCLAGLSPTQLVDLEAAMIWAATREYRLECVRGLRFFQPVIYGDAGWREILGQEFRMHPEVRYYDELPLVYQASAVNFNATSLQMKAAVNQRVFDVPAAGGFLLTDFREQLAEVLEVGREVICYREPAEIPDLVRFYLAQPRRRRRLVEAARARVLREHTYVQRLKTMLGILRSTL